MKNYSLFFVAVACLFSNRGIPQSESSTPINAVIRNTSFVAGNDTQIVSYRVEEKINKRFGGSTTTYNVSNLNLVKTNDLGPNNTRVITPKYGRKKPVALKMDLVEICNDNVPVIIEPINVNLISSKENTTYINILKTYERVLNKGYISVEMLKRVGNARYFDGDLEMAAHWYSQLFELTADLEIEFYYRYAQSLKSIGEIEKSNEMMAVFERKNVNK